MQNRRQGIHRGAFVGPRNQDAYERTSPHPKGHDRHDVLGVNGPAVRHADDIAAKPGSTHREPRRFVPVQPPPAIYLNQCLDQPTPLCT